MYEIEKLKIKQAIGGDVYEMLKANKCILAGGACQSLTQLSLCGGMVRCISQEIHMVV